jgi:hypothetical protein
MHLFDTQTRIQKTVLFALATPSKSEVEIGRYLVRKVLKKYSKAKRKSRIKPYISPVNKKNAVNSVGLKRRAKGTEIRYVGRMKLSFILVPITRCFRLLALLERERSGLRRTLSHHLRVDGKL